MGALISHCALIGALHQTLRKRLEELDLWTLYQQIELPLCPVLAEMEREGMLVDRGEQADGPYFSPPDSLPLMRFSGPVPFLQFFLIHFAFCIAFFRLARYNSFISAHKCFCCTDISVR